LRVLLLALVLSLAACGGGATSGVQPTLGPLERDTPSAVPTRPVPPTSAPTQLSATSPPPTSAPAQPSTATPAPGPTQASESKILIAYHKSGGIVGIDETLTVYDDGTIELQTKGGSTRAQAGPADIQALQKLLGSPEFAALQLGPPPVAPDQFVYELRVPGRRQPVVTADSADNPPVLDQVIDMLEKIKTAAR
jgi:hypothetical protein